MEPLRNLLKSKDKFQWNNGPGSAFKASRQEIIEAVKKVQ